MSRISQRTFFLALLLLFCITLVPRVESGMTPIAPGNSPDTLMVFVPGGMFDMGTDSTEVDGLMKIFGVNHPEVFTAEVPRHRVTLSPFYMDKYEVTNVQFKTFVDANPEWRPDRIPPQFHNGKYLAHWTGNTCPPALGNLPVVHVSWHAAVAYARWVGKRLPTEAEWEWAARGGRGGTLFPWGNDPVSPVWANYGGSRIGQPTPGGRYPANGFGLYDMAGNVWEYCLDEWGEYPTAPQINPLAGAVPSGDAFRAVTTRRVIRGGSWDGAPVNLRVAYRDSHPPQGAGPHVGFRCVSPVEMSDPR